jgi:hypothetical protein
MVSALRHSEAITPENPGERTLAYRGDLSI